jgi:hypothetical protein
MATKRKRTTTKTGNFTKRTVTVSSKGTRVTNSFRPPGGATRRTSSVNLSTGKTRLTHTTHQGNGWSTTRSKSGGIGNFKLPKSKNSKLSLDDFDSGTSLLDLLKNLIFIGIVYFVGFIVLALFLGLLFS